MSADTLEKIAAAEKLEAAPPARHPGRAIVTYGRSLMALVIARSLSERGVEVIGCDDVGMTVLSFSRHVSSNFIHASLADDEEQALIDFEEAVRRHAPDDDRPYVLMPAFRDARIFARHRERFEPLIKIAAPDWSSIELVDPKDRFARFLERHNLPGPRTRIILPREYRDIPPANVETPLIAKPVDGVGGRGVERVETRDELQRYLSESDPEAPVLLQEPIEGEDYCVSFVAVRGEAIGVVVYKNIAQFPKKAGAGAVRETVDPTPFLPATKALLKATKWNGVAEIDFRWSGKPEDEPKMLEVNPRYWAGLFHSTASGVDFPWIAYRLAAGLPVEHPAPDAVEIGFRTRTPGAWILSVAQDVAESDPHLADAAAAWEKCREHVSRGALLSALRMLADGAIKSGQSLGAIATLQERLKEHSGLPSELNSDKDPAVGLGVLFALSSIIRHGTLPPEFKFTPDEKPSEKTPEKPARKLEPLVQLLKAPPTREEAADAGVPSTPIDPPGPSQLTRRPIIGVTKPAEGDWLAFQAMRFAIWLAGGKAVVITSSAPREPHSIDGLLFGGGSDVYPKRYQGRVKEGYDYDLPRDEMEASWADAALKNDIPVLGVCRGMQMLNVLGGGTLHHDLSSFKNRFVPISFFQRLFYRVPVNVTPDSWLEEATGKQTLRVNAIHTQAIEKFGVGFVAAACEENGIPQAIEHTRSTFLIGVQFHPEYLLYHRFARNIFRALVDAAREHAAKRMAKAAGARVREPEGAD